MNYCLLSCLTEFLWAVFGNKFLVNLWCTLLPLNLFVGITPTLMNWTMGLKTAVRFYLLLWSMLNIWGMGRFVHWNVK